MRNHCVAILIAAATSTAAFAAEATFPPELSPGKTVATDTSEEFLKPAKTLRPGVKIAKTAPTIDFAYFPGQTYPGKPWSAWGDSLAAGGKYYASIGDHLAPAGNGLVYEYDPAKKTFRKLLDLKELLSLPEGHYAPGKIHSRLDLGKDGWLYCATHRGSTTVTTDKYHYLGDWVVRCDPRSGRAEVVVHAPVAKHCIPTSVLDGQRMIFYGGTAPGVGGEEADIMFFAYDVANKKLLHAEPNGPARYMILAQSTGRVYYTQGKDGSAALMRYDPASGTGPVKIDGQIGIRAATRETPQGMVYTVSQGGKGEDSTLYAFSVKTEKIEPLGPAPVGTQTYIAAMSADPTGRYLYFAPGAHGGSESDGSPLVQFDVQTRERKVIAFLHPFYQEKYGLIPKGTYSLAVDPSGERVYITWNVSRGGKNWDSVAVTTVHIPAVERTDPAEQSRRQARSPLKTAELLAKVYGRDLTTVEYIPAMALVGRLQLGDLTKDDSHRREVEQIVGPYVRSEKSTKATAGNGLSGHLVFSELAKRSEGAKRAKYIELAKAAADLAFDEGGKPKPSMPFHEEMSDALFMGGPILAQVGGLTGEKRYFDACEGHLKFMNKLVRRDDGLYRHSPLCEAAWGRGNGFPALGVALCLAEFPADHPYRPELLTAFQSHLAALAKHQDQDGAWHQVIDEPESYREYSCTAMIAFAMSRGVRAKWLDEAQFRPTIERAWKAIAARTGDDGSLAGVCTGTGKQTSLQAYFDRPAIFGRDARGGAMGLLIATELARDSGGR